MNRESGLLSSLDRRRVLSGFFVTLVVLFGLAIANCGGSGGSSDDDEDEPDPIVVPLGALVDDVDVAAGVTMVSFVFDPIVNPVRQPLTDLEVDLEETLKSLTVGDPVAPGVAAASSDGPAAGTATVTVIARVADASEIATVCADGEAYGPFVLIGDDTTKEANSIEPSSAEASQATLSIVNTGSFAICLEIDSPAPARIGIDDVTVKPKLCRKSPKNFDGLWTGTYTCRNKGCGGDDVNQPITLTVTQAGGNSHSAHYEDDGDGVYDGTVCDNVFEYNGGGEAYTESGKFTIHSDGSATKRSKFKALEGSCSGSCVDDLTRYVPPPL